jgi:signal transduction histidine kinase
MKPPPDHPLHGPRPGLTLALLLAAGTVILAGGAWLAQRTEERRIPADRALLRECGATLQGELSRLDQLFYAHLRQVSEVLATGTIGDRVQAEADKRHGIASVMLLPRHGPRVVYAKVSGPGAPPPDVELYENGRPPVSPFVLGIPRELIFGANDDAPLPVADQGWLGKPGDPWLLWWHRHDSQQAAAIVIRGAEVRAAIDRHLAALLPAVWAPVRAAGGMDSLEAPGGKMLAGLTNAPAGPADFVVPLASRLGDWQIASWDRRVTETVFHFPTLVISGTLAVGMALLGWIVAAAQRRALREVTARVSFVNRVSHELGAPLTNLRLYMELARDSLPPEAAESSRRLAVAEEETGRLIRLVQNVLTFARGERGRLELAPAPCRPAEIVRGVLDQFAPALARRKITVETDLDDSASAEVDADALAQITANLISNVEKYAASGEWMRLSLAAADGELVLRVTDRGPGIPASEAARVFEPFERLDSRLTEGVTGTGLGLAIARDLAQRMGGGVELESPAGSGCVFTVRVPLSRGSAFQAEVETKDLRAGSPSHAGGHA